MIARIAQRAGLLAGLSFPLARIAALEARNADLQAGLADVKRPRKTLDKQRGGHVAHGGEVAVDGGAG